MLFLLQIFFFCSSLNLTWGVYQSNLIDVLKQMKENKKKNEKKKNHFLAFNPISL